MIRATHDAASAMIDDLQYMRETFSKPAPTAGDLRRMSGVLRRLLIDNGGDLPKIGPPRIGRIELLSLDTLPLERANRKQPWHFLVLGKALLFRAGIGNIAVHREIDSVMPSDFDRNKIISLSLDGFLTQKVMCFQGEWASRAETIKYVANVAHGVH